MFWIRKASTKYHETSRGVAFTAHLLTTDGDVHVGIVENHGRGGATTIDTMRHFNQQLETIAKENDIMVENLLDRYMDVSEGIIPDITVEPPNPFL